ncbi:MULTISPECIES: ABC transporter permease [unclassified Beijerinckia]|uniref:ABC transporter permease n=1 Tax=unclassified Beijerinckia TaxID=2638183 RepID=UPI0008947805|nr:MULTISPECIES: ABC transporter permease [unclassified Beijerinckia]MDH7797572.1 peptide/nickel transport system permease protein [Beijerinckia sp. GAS462]SEC90930.1 peptide/nickel transport system permease protein [Beijerinckia sp. 28-YEA-48]
MWYYAARRILMSIPIALGVTVVCYALVLLAPGDPIQSLLPPDASPEDAAYLRKAYGFDKPVPIQYLLWLQRALTGDLGISLQTNRPVIQEVLSALSNTFVISVGAVLLAFSLAFILGTIAAYNLGKPVDRIATGVAVVGVSVPNYWLGIVLVIVFAVKLGVLPATGMGSAGSSSFSIFDWDQAKYAILPILTMSLVPLGIIMRTTRSAVAEVLNNDFVQMLRAKGLGPIAILRHAIWNALPQVLTVMGLQLGYLVGGSILVETIFTWPGTGFLMSKAILTRDVPVLQGAILVLSLTFVTINLMVDLLQTAVDPRIKRA